MSKSILFGLDGSEFATQALVRVGGLLKNTSDLKITLFHGDFPPDTFSYSDTTAKEPGALEKHWEKWRLETRKNLDHAAEALKGSGFDPRSTSMVLDQKCTDPSDAMLKLALREGIDTIAVARWGKSSLSRQVMGTVTYRLSQLAEQSALWVIDPRICSHNVLIGLVGAPVSRRIVNHAVRYFSHLTESKFTLMHVKPPLPPQFWQIEGTTAWEGHELQDKMLQWSRAYTDSVIEMAEDAKDKLVQAGIPPQNVVFRLEPQKRGIARDMLVELEEGDHGILVIGRKGYKAIKEFGLGSKAYKLLVNGRAFVVCLVN